MKTVTDTLVLIAVIMVVAFAAPLLFELIGFVIVACIYVFVGYVAIALIFGSFAGLFRSANDDPKAYAY